MSLDHQPLAVGRRGGRRRPAFVATTGGHLVEMRLLASLLEPERHRQALWITHRTPQSETVLAGEDVLFVDFVHTRDLRAAVRVTPEVVAALRAHRVDAVYSTGAAIAVSALSLARFVGARATYIESLTRPSGPSMSGRLLSFLPWVRTLTQYETRAGARWHYRASLMDGFATVPAPRTGPPTRIFVTVGTAGRYGFRRLLDRLVTILPPECEVVWQTGATSTTGLDVTARPMMTDTEFQREIERADVVVAHAGCGTFLRCLELGKVPVLAPRRSAHDEHVDDHQEQLARTAAERGLAVMRQADEVDWAALCEAASLAVERRHPMEEESTE